MAFQRLPFSNILQIPFDSLSEVLQKQRTLLALLQHHIFIGLEFLFEQHQRFFHDVNGYFGVCSLRDRVLASDPISVDISDDIFGFEGRGEEGEVLLGGKGEWVLSDGRKQSDQLLGSCFVVDIRQFVGKGIHSEVDGEERMKPFISILFVLIVLVVEFRNQLHVDLQSESPHYFRVVALFVNFLKKVLQQTELDQIRRFSSHRQPQKTIIEVLESGLKHRLQIDYPKSVQGFSSSLLNSHFVEGQQYSIRVEEGAVDLQSFNGQFRNFSQVLYGVVDPPGSFQAYPSQFFKHEIFALGSQKPIVFGVKRKPVAVQSVDLALDGFVY